MWLERFALGRWCWEHDTGKLLFIVHRKQFDVDLHNTTKTSRDTFDEAKRVVERYMQENP